MGIRGAVYIFFFAFFLLQETFHFFVMTFLDVKSGLYVIQGSSEKAAYHTRHRSAEEVTPKIQLPNISFIQNFEVLICRNSNHLLRQVSDQINRKAPPKGP